MSWTFLDAVFYINLARRTDRRLLIEEEITKLGLPNSCPIHRVEALDTSDVSGHKGCAWSHATVMRLAQEYGYKNAILVLEDDAQLVVDVAVMLRDLSDFFGSTPNWDIALVGTH